MKARHWNTLHEHFKSGLRGTCALAVLIAYCAQGAPLPEFEGLIEPSMTVELHSPVEGIIESITVDRSDVIKQGQVLVKLRADVEEALFAVASAKASFNKRKQARADDLYSQKAIPFSDKDEAASEARLSELQMRHARETLNLRTIRSPIDGIVAERYLSPGESVKDKTIFKLVQIDPLRVELLISEKWFGAIRPGMRAEVRLEVGSVGPQTVTVTVVDKVIDAVSGTFGVRLDMPNRAHKIPSGLRCKVRFLSD